MTFAIRSDAVIGPQSIRLAVTRLGDGFARMHALGAELTMLDAVNKDICHTQASIRRDVANMVLQTALSLKNSQEVASVSSEASTPNADLEVTLDGQSSDLWAIKIVRWADRLGRGLFGVPSARAVDVKRSHALPPPQER